MKCTIPEISWHNRDPVLSIDFQPQRINENFYRLASGGTDTHVLIWRVSIDEDENTSVEFVSDLTRHQKAVNAVRFSPNGEQLASGDDESAIIIWRLKQDTEAPELLGGDSETSGKEQWTIVRTLRGHLEDVYDLCWSPDSNCLVSGSVDNTAIVWDVTKGTKLGLLDSHKGFVQGVAWDPLGQYLATLSSDRKMRVYNTQTRKLVSQVGKSLLPVPKGDKLEGKHVNLFHDDTIQTYFRRLCFSPDGQMVIAPSGVIEPQEPGQKASSTTLVFARNLLNRPVMYLPSLDEYSTCVRCCPVLFELRNLDPSTKPESMFLLPYRVVFAVATACAIVLYDTQQPMPFGYISNLHYTRLTDLAWSSDGDMLMVSSTDGYCSVITFSEGELGVPYKEKNASREENTVTVKKEMEITPGKEKNASSKKSESSNVAGTGKIAVSITETTPRKEVKQESMEIDSCEKDVKTDSANEQTDASVAEKSDKDAVKTAVKEHDHSTVHPETVKQTPDDSSDCIILEDDADMPSEVKDASVVSKEEVKVASILSQDEVKDTSIAGKEEVKDTSIAGKEEVKDTSIASKEEVKDTSIASKEEVKDTSIASKEEVKDTLIASKEEVKDTSIASKEEVKDTSIAGKEEVKDTSIASKEEVKDTSIAGKEEVKDATIIIQEDIQDAAIVSKEVKVASVISEATGVENGQSGTDLSSEMQSKLGVSEKVVTPVDSGKKARRVQLITLSSPKSKKKL